MSQTPFEAPEQIRPADEMAHVAINADGEAVNDTLGVIDGVIEIDCVDDVDIDRDRDSDAAARQHKG